MNPAVSEIGNEADTSHKPFQGAPGVLANPTFKEMSRQNFTRTQKLASCLNKIVKKIKLTSQIAHNHFLKLAPERDLFDWFAFVNSSFNTFTAHKIVTEVSGM